MKKNIILILLLLVSFNINENFACTIGVASGKATSDGRPLLWKNRDISPQYFNNDIRFLKGEVYNFLALQTVGYPEKVWAGTNNAGFCIINAASKDLAGTNREGPGNGEFMKRALGNCASAKDFEVLLQKTNWPGRKTNCIYGVIDATGAAVLYETRNYSYTKFDANDNSVAPKGFIVRANFSLTADGKGGVERYRRANALWENAIQDNKLNYRQVLRYFARDLADTSGVPYQLPVKNCTNTTQPYEIEIFYTINRSTTTAAIVFTGIKSGENPELTTMWSLLGQPIFSISSPAWVKAAAAPEKLFGTDGSEIRRIAAKLYKAFYYSRFENNKKRHYLTTFGLPVLFSELHLIEDEIFDATDNFLEVVRRKETTPKYISAFQDEMSRKALAGLEKTTELVLSKKPIKAGVFSGEGASPVCIKETIAALQIDRGIIPIAVNAVDIMTGFLDDIDVLVFPGGSGSKQSCNLGSMGRKKVQQFVLEKGKGCVGICAGAYLLSSTSEYPWSLKLISADVFDRAHYNRGRGLIEIAFSKEGKQIFPEVQGDKGVYVQYYDGPVLIRSANSNIPVYKEDALYVSDIHLTGGSSAGITPGKTALLHNAAGNGMVFACVGHPESTPGMRWMVPRMVRFVAKRQIINYADMVTRPERDTTAILFEKDIIKLEKKLFWSLVGKNPEEKIAALSKLVQLRSRPALRWAIGLLRDDDPDVRSYAANVLAEAEYTPAINDLRVAIKLEQDNNNKFELKKCLDHLMKIIE